MNALVFPPPPLTIGQQYPAPNGVTYEWDGDAWIAASGTTAPLWTDNAATGLMGTSNAGRSLALSRDTSLHFGDPAQDCPCIDADGDDLVLEVTGTCRVTIGGETVATFDAGRLTLQGSLVASGPVVVGPAFQAPDAPRGAVALDPDNHFWGYAGGGAWLQLDGVVGPASGDLTGHYPAPSVRPGLIPTTLPPSGPVPAGGALTGAYPSPGVDYTKIANAPVPPTIPTTLPPSGPVPAGDLAGSSYPSPVIAAGAVTAAKIAAGVLPTTLPPSGAAGGDLAGSTFPAPVIKAGAVTAAKIAAGVIPTTLPPSGSAGGDLAGSTYPSPVIAPGSVTLGKLAPGTASGAVVQESLTGQTITFTTTEVTLYTKTLTTTHGGGILIVACPQISMTSNQTVTPTLNLKLDGVQVASAQPGPIQIPGTSLLIYSPTLMWFAAAQSPGAHTITVTAVRVSTTGTVTFTAISFMALELA